MRQESRYLIIGKTAGGRVTNPRALTRKSYSAEQALSDYLSLNYDSRNSIGRNTPFVPANRYEVHKLEDALMIEIEVTPIVSHPFTLEVI